MDNKGQGALEYLLLIGGAVLIAAIVIVILNSLGTTGVGAKDIGATKVDTAYGELNNLG
ncbi:MAG: class III signal peptide-containing protein [Candidatus Diapherotrites archaeon]